MDTRTRQPKSWRRRSADSFYPVVPELLLRMETGQHGPRRTRSQSRRGAASIPQQARRCEKHSCKLDRKPITHAEHGPVVLAAIIAAVLGEKPRIDLIPPRLGIGWHVNSEASSLSTTPLQVERAQPFLFLTNYHAKSRILISTPNYLCYEKRTYSNRRR
jgi:hypothetical protein